MRYLLIAICCLVLVGCAGSGEFYKVPADEYQQKVKTLGVLPILVDAETISHADRQGVVAMLHQENRVVPEKLIAELRKRGDYFDVRFIEADPVELLERLVAERTPAGEKDGRHLVYSFAPDGVAGVTADFVVDGLLVVIIHGVDRQEKRWNPHSTRMEYLTTEYSSLLYTAAIVTVPSDKMWEYVMPAGEPFLYLDYPDFSEAYWNRTENVVVREITLKGLQRTVTEKDEGLFSGGDFPKRYRELVEAVVKGLRPPKAKKAQ